MDYRSYIAERIAIEGISASEIAGMMTVPPDLAMGDYALPCFRFAKALKKSPQAIAVRLASQIAADEAIERAEAVSGYLNITLNRSRMVSAAVREILEKGEDYGRSNVGAGKTVCIDYSSINIAKPFHIGHLSTTVIGSSLYKIFNFLGYRSVGINHLGDYGTQFGKLIVAYKRWGDRETVERENIREMLRLYVRFHEEAEKDPALDEEARHWFKRIEDKDPEALELFEWFKELTLKEVAKVYELLGVTFDSYAGESFYNDKMQPVLDELESKGLLTVSEGAKVVDLEAYGMPPCLLVKADGATLYATRDIAAAFYRKKTYDFDQCLYVVAYQQNLHFKQFFKVIELMGYEWAKDLKHVAFGMVSMEGGSMSTRKGKVIFLEEVLSRCIEKALAIITEKNPSLKDKESIAKDVGVGAVIFSTLSANRIKDITFSYDRVLNFEGETGPYVQYTYARCNSVMGKADFEPEKADFSQIAPEENALVSLLMSFPEVVLDAADKYEPSFITRLMVDIAQAYNKFYIECRILGESEGVMNKRLALTRCTMQVLKSGLGLLGIKTVDRM